MIGSPLRSEVGQCAVTGARPPLAGVNGRSTRPLPARPTTRISQCSFPFSGPCITTKTVSRCMHGRSMGASGGGSAPRPAPSADHPEFCNFLVVYRLMAVVIRF